MRRIGIWFFLSCKRYLHRWSFLIILLLLPFGAFLIRESQKEEASEIRIAVCITQEGAPNDTFGKETQETGALEERLLEVLVSREPGEGLFRFYRCENEQQVKDEVSSRRAECGYVIPADLQKQLDRRKFKRCIRVYSAPSTIAAELSSEVVFAAMIELHDRELFAEYMKEMLDTAETGEKDDTSGTILAPAQDDILEAYDKWKENGSTFHFTYESLDRQGQTDAQLFAASVFPVRGIVAVYLFVTGLYSAAISLADERKHLFLAIPSGSRTWCRLAAMAAPVFLAGISGLAALVAGNIGWRGGRELAALAGYGAAVVIVSWAVRLICRREALICCLIPFFLVGSLVFCPVFLDIGKYIPQFRMLGKFFLPWYYLKLFI